MSLDGSPLWSMSVDSRAAMVLLRVWLSLAIFFKTFGCIIHCICGKVFCLRCKACFHCLHFLADYCGTFCDGLLYYYFYDFFPNELEGAFSIVFIVSAKVVVTSLRPSLVGSSAEGLDIPSKLLGWGKNSIYLLHILWYFLYIAALKQWILHTPVNLPSASLLKKMSKFFPMHALIFASKITLDFNFFRFFAMRINAFFLPNCHQ